MLKGAFIVFLLPLIFAGLGGFLAGWELCEENEIYAVYGAALGFFAGGLFIKWYDKRASDRQNEQPVITEIIS